MLRLLTLICLLLLASGRAARSQDKDSAKLTVDRIYGGGDLSAKGYSGRWLPDSSGWTRVVGSSLQRVDPRTLKAETMVSAAELTPGGQSSPLKIDDYQFSADLSRVLIYTNSQRVWRRNTRGDYWILDRSARQLWQLGTDGPAASMMFAKFSPDGQQVAFVRDRDIYLEDLLDRKVRRLTTATNEHVINGTTDWVYEEEFGLRDGFRWCPDGQSIAYWSIDTTGVQRFPLVNNTDSLYPRVNWFAYPKVGQRNSKCRVGIVGCETGKTRWIELPGDTRNHYVPRLHWAGAKELLIQQLNRLQNTNRIFLTDAATRRSKVIRTESDKCWVDVHDELFWHGDQFSWISEKSGWRHVYLCSRHLPPTQVTKGKFDVIQLLTVNADRGECYFIASPEQPSERYLFRVGSDGGDLRRVTPEGERGTHAYKVSPDGKWALHTFSSTDDPPRVELVELPSHKVVKVLEDNAKLRKKLAALRRQPTEFFRVDIGNNIELEAWCMKPPQFDPKHKYPLMMYVYGEPAGQTVVNRWGGSGYLWHQLLAQRGYVVMSFDNRGTKSPRGREWRKSVYEKVGVISPREQAAAVRAVLKQRPYLDSKRVGIWGWSGGGSSSLQAIFKYPDIYHTAIAIAPVPNQRYYDTIYQERYMGLPETNVEGFRQGSPINFAKNLKGNLLLIHGTGDDNCHYQTMELLIDELIAHDKQFSMMAYPNRTHSIRERKNTTRHLRKLMTRFLLNNLPPDQK